MDENHGSRSAGGCSVERIEIDLPTVIIELWIRNEFNIGEIGQKLEQRIARLGEKNFVTGIAEQTENVRVGLAGAGSQNQALGLEIDFVRFTIVATHGLARSEQSPRLGIVMHCFRVRQRGENDVTTW